MGARSMRRFKGRRKHHVQPTCKTCFFSLKRPSSMVCLSLRKTPVACKNKGFQNANTPVSSWHGARTMAPVWTMPHVLFKQMAGKNASRTTGSSGALNVAPGDRSRRLAASLFVESATRGCRKNCKVYYSKNLANSPLPRRVKQTENWLADTWPVSSEWCYPEMGSEFIANRGPGCRNEAPWMAKNGHSFFG